jgi:hypothetical protein
MNVCRYTLRNEQDREKWGEGLQKESEKGNKSSIFGSDRNCSCCVLGEGGQNWESV